MHANILVQNARVGGLGLRFKENCSDLRNSKVPDILRELSQFGVQAIVHDPIASAEDAMNECRVKLAPLDEMGQLDALVLAVSHKWYLDVDQARISGLVRDGGVLVDVKSVLDPSRIDRDVCYWSL